MNFSLTSRSLLAFSLVLSVPLLTGANGNGCGSAVVIGNENGGGTSTITCASDACGPAAPAIAQLCPDGTSVGPVCGPTSNGTCGWTFHCPTGTCTTTECGAVPPVPLCPGGGTVSPVCGPTSNGTCGWTVPSCPSTTCNASQCGAKPAVEVDCNGTVVTPVCQSTGQNQCGWVFPPCVPLPADDAGTCTTPQPQNCNSITECACLDGTTQVGGCPNGFTCAEACCGHGGAK
jgi:hypothetical protein